MSMFCAGGGKLIVKKDLQPHLSHAWLPDAIIVDK